MPQFTLTLHCPERAGIVHAVTSFLVDHGCDIVQHQQFDDDVRGKLFLRTAFSCDGVEADDLAGEFAKVATQFEMDFDLWDDRPPRVLVMVSKAGHCLNDLLFRWRAGGLGGEIAAIVSNHEDLRPMAEAAGLDFVHVPNTADTKHFAEQRLVELVDEYQADLVVLARYMQVLSNDLCAKLVAA